jgi:uncharacterized protein
MASSTFCSISSETAGVYSQDASKLMIDDSIIEHQALAKQERLLAGLGRLDSVLVAFSGGADSAYLAWAAHTALGNRALAVTAVSPSFSNYDREQAVAVARQVGLRYEQIDTREFENQLYVANNPDRCYHCKDELFTRMEALARERGFAALAYGINADDTHDFRPGHRAATEHQVLAPLLTASLTKAEVRAARVCLPGTGRHRHASLRACLTAHR